MVVGGAPLYEALLGYLREGVVRFHTPGHKGRVMAGSLWSGAPDDTLTPAKFAPGPLAIDLTEVPGLDDLHAPTGPIARAQELAADAFGADETFFLVNGSTVGIQAAIMALCGPGDEIVIPRHAHRSVTSGLILSGARPVYVQPEYDADRGLLLGVTPDAVARALDAHPGARAVLVVHPTYHGLASNIERIVENSHHRGVPVLADEAHGAHFAFHPTFPTPALRAGADVAVQSVHKTLGSLTQSSLLHVKGSAVDRGRLRAALRLLQSTSPSYLLMASLDVARHLAATQGSQLLSEALALTARVRAAASGLPGLACYGDELLRLPSVKGFDPTKIIISPAGLGLSGKEAEALLRVECGLQMEMSDDRNVLALVTIADTEESTEALCRGLQALLARRRAVNPEGATAARLPTGPAEVILTPREAFYAPAEPVRIERAFGRLSVETIAAHPPGIPLLCPGERISLEMVAYLEGARAVGISFQGPADPTLGTLMVVK